MKLPCMECSAFPENSTSLQGMFYFMDFIDTAHNFARRKKKLISPVFKKRYTELIISKITKFVFQSTTFHSIFRSDNALN